MVYSSDKPFFFGVFYLFSAISEEKFELALGSLLLAG